MSENGWWRLYRTTNIGKQTIWEHFLYRLSLGAVQLLKEMKKGKLFGYVQCNIHVPENLTAKFAKFPPFFRNTLVSKNDIENLMKNNAEKAIFSQPRKILVSSFTLQNCTLIAVFFLFHVQFGLVCTKIDHFVDYTLKKSLHSFVQSAVDARTNGAKNLVPSVVADTMKLLANSSYGYQIIDRWRLTMTKYLSDKKTHAAINSELLKELNHLNNTFYEVEWQNSQNEHKSPSLLDFSFFNKQNNRNWNLTSSFSLKSVA